MKFSYSESETKQALTHWVKVSFIPWIAKVMICDMRIITEMLFDGNSTA